jgi:antitoxin StbD
MQQVYASITASISELKKNPSHLLLKANGEPIAILNHNKTAAYLVPASRYAAMMDLIEDQELSVLIDERLKDIDQAISVDLNDL